MCWEYFNAVDASGTVTAVAAVCAAGAAAYAAIYAYRGLSTWKEHTEGAAKRQLAIEMMLAAVRFKHALWDARCPVDDWTNKGSFDDADFNDVQDKRVRPVRDAYTLLLRKAEEMEVVFKFSTNETISPFRDLNNKFASSVESFFSKYRRVCREEATKNNQDDQLNRDLVNLKQIIHRPLEASEQDAFNEEVEKAVGALDKMLRPFIDLK